MARKPSHHTKRPDTPRPSQHRLAASPRSPAPYCIAKCDASSPGRSTARTAGVSGQTTSSNLTCAPVWTLAQQREQHRSPRPVILTPTKLCRLAQHRARAPGYAQATAQIPHCLGLCSADMYGQCLLKSSGSRVCTGVHCSQSFVFSPQALLQEQTCLDGHHRIMIPPSEYATASKQHCSTGILHLLPLCTTYPDLGSRADHTPCLDHWKLTPRLSHWGLGPLASCTSLC